jgi:hypothetical protein
MSLSGRFLLLWNIERKEEGSVNEGAAVETGMVV